MMSWEISSHRAKNAICQTRNEVKLSPCRLLLNRAIRKDRGLCCHNKIVLIELFQATAILLEMSSRTSSMSREVEFYRRLIDSFLKNATFSRDRIRKNQKIREQFLSVLQSWQLCGINASILRIYRWYKQAEVWWSFHPRHLRDGWSAFLWVLLLNHLFNDGHFKQWMGTPV